MKERIKKIRKEEGLTQKEFAKKIGVKQNTVATYEIGKIKASDSVIRSICREFGINEDWLKYGTGEMKKKVSTDYKIAAEMIGDTDPRAKNAIISYWKLSSDEKKLLWDFIDRFLK